MTAYIGLGSNIEPRRKALAEACTRLSRHTSIRLDAESSVIETDAFDMNDTSGAFMNQVVAVKTTLSPTELLAVLQEIERQLGRTDKGRRLARTIDLDLLLYGEECLHSESLTIPHPEMTRRLFVLEPLLDIAPDLRHPGTGRRFSNYGAFLRQMNHQALAEAAR